jgi:hypothetical protein
MGKYWMQNAMHKEWPESVHDEAVMAMSANFHRILSTISKQ